MSRTRTFKHKWLGPFLVGLLLVTALVLAGCGAEQEVAQEPAAPTSVPAEEAAPTALPTEPPPTQAPTEPPPTEVPTEPPPTDTPEPTEEPTPEVVDDTACIACHTDEETLKAVAEVEEVEESLSEGEG